MYCSKCGADNKEGSGFCSACGSPLMIATENSVPVKKKSKKPLIIVIAILLVALAVVAVILLTPKDTTEENAREVYVPESCTYFDSDGTPCQTCTYTYNADGTLKQLYIFYEEGYHHSDGSSDSLTEITNYSYDSDSRIITASTKNVIGDTNEIFQTYRIDFYYNEYGLVTKAFIYDYEVPLKHFEAKYVDRIVYEYDSDRNVISSLYYRANYDEDLGSYVNSYNSEPRVGRLYFYTSDTEGSRLESVEFDVYDDGRVSSSSVNSYIYSNDNNTIKVKHSEEGYEPYLDATYNCRTIENTSEIDMQSFMTIIALF